MPDEMDMAQAEHEAFLNARIAQVRAAGRPPLNLRVGAADCGDCGEAIPEKRRNAVQGCSRCIDCQTNFEEGR